MSDEDVARAIYTHVSGGKDPDAEGWQNYGVDGEEAYGEELGKEAYLALARALRSLSQPEDEIPTICHECGEQVTEDLNENGECLACEQWLDRNPRNED